MKDTQRDILQDGENTPCGTDTENRDIYEIAKEILIKYEVAFRELAK